MTYTGKITRISELDPNNTGHEKKYVYIETFDQSTYKIEFKGWKLKLLNMFKAGDIVSIDTFGKYCESSRGTGFNNIIAKNIQSLELHYSSNI